MSDTGSVPKAGVYTQLTENLGRIIAPNPGPMTGWGTNTYIVSKNAATDKVAIIDPGPALQEHVDAIVSHFGERITDVVVTHTHSDHSPAAAMLAAQTGARIWGDSPAPDALYQDETFVADEPLSDEQLLDLNGVAVRAIHTPGHVDNHYCFLLEKDQVLLTGDHLMNGSTVVIIPPAGVMKDYIESLQKLKNYPLSQFGPGHGDLMSHCVEILDWTIEHRLKREQKVIEKLQDLPPLSLQDLTPAVYDDVDKSLYPMARMSLWAHLIKLQSDGLAIEQDGCWALIK